MPRLPGDRQINGKTITQILRYEIKVVSNDDFASVLLHPALWSSARLAERNPCYMHV
jgi:hypothetical protein